MIIAQIGGMEFFEEVPFCVGWEDFLPCVRVTTTHFWGFGGLEYRGRGAVQAWIIF
jgi:hypothetical protein